MYGNIEEEKDNRIINKNLHKIGMGVFILKNIFAIIMVIIGSIIGAGFASGQEINSFFYKYGINGISGILISIIIISFTIYKVFKIARKNNINTYKDFLKIILKTKNNKYLNMSNITNIVINIFLIISFYIMIAGFGAYFKQEYNLNSIIGSFVLAFICFMIFLGNVERLLKVNKYLVPILIVFLLVLGYMNISNINFTEISNKSTDTNFGEAIWSGIIYASYNIILLIPALITLKDKIENNENIVYIAVIPGMILFVLALIIFFLISNIKININAIEMPAVYVIGMYFTKFREVYGFIILSSILTTAISEGISFLENVVKTKKSYTQVATILCITSVIFSKIGFSNLINLLYPIFGILGLLQIFVIIKIRVKN